VSKSLPRSTVIKQSTDARSRPALRSKTDNRKVGIRSVEGRHGSAHGRRSLRSHRKWR
jgi:hypothetical protein